MKVLGVIQARVSSTRLPGKALSPILGEPMLARQIERVRRAGTLDELVIATSIDRADDELAALCDAVGVACFRGALDDVLDRIVQAVRSARAEHVVRLTGDCPLADPAVIDDVVRAHLDGGVDYTSNVRPPTFPDGLDVEVLRASALETLWREATLPSEREHVTLYLGNHPERFRSENVRNAVDLSGLRWTVDEPADLEFVTAVYEALYPRDHCFSMDDVLGLLETRPQMAKINAGIERNAGLRPSLEADGAISDHEEAAGV